MSSTSKARWWPPTRSFAGNAARASAELSADRLAARSGGAAATVPLGREGRYAEIARSVLFLASATDAGYITGSELVIDGGLRLT